MLFYAQTVHSLGLHFHVHTVQYVGREVYTFMKLFMQDTNAVDLNLNNATCLREKTGFTSTQVYNVCNGEAYSLPHGGADYLAGGVVFTLMALFIFVLYRVATDY